MTQGQLQTQWQWVLTLFPSPTEQCFFFQRGIAHSLTTPGEQSKSRAVLSVCAARLVQKPHYIRLCIPRPGGQWGESSPESLLPFPLHSVLRHGGAQRVQPQKPTCHRCSPQNNYNINLNNIAMKDNHHGNQPRPGVVELEGLRRDKDTLSLSLG